MHAFSWSMAACAGSIQEFAQRGAGTARHTCPARIWLVFMQMTLDCHAVVTCTYRPVLAYCWREGQSCRATVTRARGRPAPLEFAAPLSPMPGEGVWQLLPG